MATNKNRDNFWAKFFCYVYTRIQNTQKVKTENHRTKSNRKKADTKFMQKQSMQEKLCINRKSQKYRYIIYLVRHQLLKA